MVKIKGNGQPKVKQEPTPPTPTIISSYYIQSMAVYTIKYTMKGESKLALIPARVGQRHLLTVHLQSCTNPQTPYQRKPV